MRYLLLLLLTFSFNTFSQVPDPSYGLPELASEERIRELNTKKRAKVMSASVARKVQSVIEALSAFREEGFIHNRCARPAGGYEELRQASAPLSE